MQPIEERPYQRAIVNRTLDSFDEGLESVMVVSPTGSGKTVMGLQSAKAIQESDPNVGVAWVALRRTLLQQVVEVNEQVGVKNLIPLSAFDREVTAKVAGFERIMLVLDEAHHSAADTCVALWDTVTPFFTIGLSATPMRTDNLRLCFQRVLQEAGYHRLIQDGYLSQYAHYLLQRYTPHSVAAAYLAEPSKWGRAAIFFRTAEECHTCHDLLVAGGARSDVVTASTDRETQLENFEAGRTDVLLNMAVLSEGWDCPSLQTVFVRDSSKGPSIQMGGRVLRRHRDCPIKNIVQSKNTDWNFGRTAMPKVCYSETETGHWLSVTPNTKLLLDAIKAADEKMRTHTFALDPRSTQTLALLHNKAARAKRARRLEKAALGEE